MKTVVLIGLLAFVAAEISIENTCKLFSYYFLSKDQAWISFYLSSDRLSGRNIASEKGSFRSDIRQKIFLKEINSSIACVALKIIWW